MVDSRAAMANKQEKRRRREFFLKLILFLGIISLLIFYPELLTKDYGIPQSLLNAVIFYTTANIVISFSRLSLVALYLRRHHREIGFKNNFIIGINQIASILSSIILVFAVFFLFDINPRELFTSLSIIAAAIAILFKDYITNMINGLIIMFSNQLSIDDFVKIGDYRGRIVDITLMNVHLLNEDDDIIYIANNAIITGNIVNYTKRNLRKIALEFTLHPEQIIGLNELEQYLVNSLEPYANNILKKSISMRVINISNNNVSIIFQLTLNEKNRRLEKEIRRHINWQIISYMNYIKEKKATEANGQDR